MSAGDAGDIFMGSTRADCAGRVGRRRVHQKTNTAIKARPTTPPTRPPATAPAFDECELELEPELAGTDVEAVLLEILPVALAVVVDPGILVDSGPPAAAWAARGRNWSLATTSRYAQ